MTEFTDEQIERIKTALKGLVDDAFVDKFTDNLRPKPKFAKGQVVFEGHYDEYIMYEEGMSGNKCRALTLDEMGPLPREMYEMINDAMSYAATDLIKRFKEVHGDA